MTNRDIGEWQRRLEDCFSYKGVVGGRLLPAVMKQEKICGAHFVHKFHGHRVLADSFLDFFAVTLRSAAAGHDARGWPAHPYYVPCLVEFLTQFRGMRAAEILSVSGYPLDGYALQRNLKDMAIFIGSIVGGISSFPWLYGLKTPPTSRPWSEKDHRNVRNSRRDEEVRILDQMIGTNSGLGAENIKALQQWNGPFNMQVHGARLATTREVDAWLQNHKSFAVGPRIDDDGSAMYMNSIYRSRMDDASDAPISTNRRLMVC